MRSSIHRSGRASCFSALLFSVGVIAGCAQQQPANPSGSGGSGGTTTAGTGGSGSGGSQNVGTGGIVASGGSTGAAGVIGSGGITGTGGSVSTGTGGTGFGTGGFSTGGSGAGGIGPGTGAAGAGTGGAASGIGGAFAGTSGGSAGAGARAAPSTDPTTFGLNGPSKCAAGTFAICEDFESTAVGAIPTGWTKEGTWAAVVSTGDKARGNQSLQISVGTANNERGFLNKTAAQLGALASMHYGRIFYKLENPPTKFVHWDFFHGPGPYGAGGNTNDVRWGFTGLPGPVTYLFNVQPTTGGGEFGINSPTSVQLVYNTWTCVEWLLDSTVAGGGEARFWVNGTEVTNMHRTGTQAQIPVFTRYGIGWELYNSTDTASTAYIDEVVFDSQRIGCNN